MRLLSMHYRNTLIHRTNQANPQSFSKIQSIDALHRRLTRGTAFPGKNVKGDPANKEGKRPTNSKRTPCITVGGWTVKDGKVPFSSERRKS